MAESISVTGVAESFRDCFPFPVEVIARASTVSAPVLPSERALIQRAVANRQADFVTGRWCAHEALLKLGFPVTHIGIGKLGEPEWPQDVAGSITHESGICVAAATRRTTVQRIGIDLLDTTRDIDLTDLLHLFMNTEDKYTEVEKLSAGHRAMLFFTIKESIVKTVSNPAIGYLDLTKISVHILDGNSFQARLSMRSAQINGVWRYKHPFFMAAAFTYHKPNPIRVHNVQECR